MLSLFDLLFPRFCVGCQVEGTWLCLHCFKDIKREKRLWCGDCSLVTPDGGYCPEHAPTHQLAGLITASHFHKGALREAIHNLKYNGVRELAKPLSQLVRERLAGCPSLAQAIVVPIPLHPQRQLDRGYNQAELLARGLFQDKRSRWLIRYRVRPPQASLSHEARVSNLTGVFMVPSRYLPHIRGQTIILVDDVATTGSTLEEAAKVLKTAGASAVWGVVIAKG